VKRNITIATYKAIISTVFLVIRLQKGKKKVANVQPTKRVVKLIRVLKLKKAVMGT
jgi:hypothetical protein